MSNPFYVGDVDSEAGEVTVSFDGCAVVYGFGELDVLVPAYAATIHKSQGTDEARRVAADWRAHSLNVPF